jgi:hypothetical protein
MWCNIEDHMDVNKSWSVYDEMKFWPHFFVVLLKSTAGVTKNDVYRHYFESRTSDVTTQNI